MEDSQEKDYSFLGNDKFPNLYNALAYERKFKSEYLKRQIYEWLLKSEPSIVKLMENNLQRIIKIYIEWTFHRKIFRESKRTLIKANFISSQKNMLQGDLDVLVNWAEFHCYF